MVPDIDATLLDFCNPHTFLRFDGLQLSSLRCLSKIIGSFGLPRTGRHPTCLRSRFYGLGFRVELFDAFGHCFGITRCGLRSLSGIV